MRFKNYEQLNAGHGNDPFTINRYRQFFYYFSNNFEWILDVGCNTGRGGNILKKLNANLKIIALDCLKDCLDRLPSGIYEQKLCSYSTEIALEDSSVDAVVAGEFIEHLYFDDVVQTLQEFYRVIKPQGRLLLTTPNPDYLRWKLLGGGVLGGPHVS
jgi:ubiquinone/menaquinone biosynthesis C-methylase UbiE